MKTLLSSNMARWLSVVLLICTNGLLVFHFMNSIWTVSIDIALHYALTARISENWPLLTRADPSLEEMNVYPPFAHQLAAAIGGWVGSPLTGMQVVAFLSLAVLWSAVAFMFLSLPRHRLWWGVGLVALLLLVNRAFVQLELFGSELVGNYFYPQLVAQAAAIAVFALVLWMEKVGAPRAAKYVLLGLSALLIEQSHLLPAVEVLAGLALLVVMDILASVSGRRWKANLTSVIVLLGSVVLLVSNPAFATAVDLSDNNGSLLLRYTSDLTTLAIECLLVIALSIFLVAKWIRLDSTRARIDLLLYKYLGSIGMAIGSLCLFQILILNAGYGSVYASKKYAFGLNTMLLLLGSAILIEFLNTRGSTTNEERTGWPRVIAEGTLPALFVSLALLTVLPSPSAAIMTVPEIVSAERFVKEHSVSDAANIPGKYDYGIALFRDFRVFDYLISIGTLKAPRANNADDLLNNRPLSKPRLVRRIFTRQGVEPWDIPGCRQQETTEGIVILNGPCVVKEIRSAVP